LYFDNIYSQRVKNSNWYLGTFQKTKKKIKKNENFNAELAFWNKKWLTVYGLQIFKKKLTRLK